MTSTLSCIENASLRAAIDYGRPTHQLIDIYIYAYTRCLNIQGTHVTANNSTTNNIAFFFVSD